MNALLRQAALGERVRYVSDIRLWLSAKTIVLNALAAREKRSSRYQTNRTSTHEPDHVARGNCERVVRRR